MNDYIFALFMRVIMAAKEGRYCYGNGTLWHIVERNHPVFIDTVRGIGEFTHPNPVAPHTSIETARSLEQFLMLQKGSSQDTVLSGYHHRKMVVDAILQADANGNLLYTNGNQYFVKYGNYVTVYSIGYSRQEVRVSHKDALSSWQYIQANGGYTVRLDKETRNYIRV